MKYLQTETRVVRVNSMGNWNMTRFDDSTEHMNTQANAGWKLVNATTRFYFDSQAEVTVHYYFWEQSEED